MPLRISPLCAAGSNPCNTRFDLGYPCSRYVFCISWIPSACALDPPDSAYGNIPSGRSSRMTVVCIHTRICTLRLSGWHLGIPLLSKSRIGNPHTDTRSNQDACITQVCSLHPPSLQFLSCEQINDRFAGFFRHAKAPSATVLP